MLCGDFIVLWKDSIVVQQDSIVLQQDSIVLWEDSIVLQQDFIVLRQGSIVVWEDPTVVREDSTVVRQDSTVVWEDSTVVWEENCVRKKGRVCIFPQEPFFFGRKTTSIKPCVERISAYSRLALEVSGSLGRPSWAERMSSCSLYAILKIDEIG